MIIHLAAVAHALATCVVKRMAPFGCQIAGLVVLTSKCQINKRTGSFQTAVTEGLHFGYLL